MGESIPRAGSFRSDLERAAGNVVLLTWSGHMGRDAIDGVIEALDLALEGTATFIVVIDATDVSGYDPAVRAKARRWAAGPSAERVRAVAIISDSQLAAAESPAAAMAPPRKARLFGSRRAAMAYVQTAAFASSGEYAVIDGVPTKIANGAQ